MARRRGEQQRIELRVHHVAGDVARAQGLLAEQEHKALAAVAQDLLAIDAAGDDALDVRDGGVAEGTAHRPSVVGGLEEAGHDSVAAIRG